MALSPWPTDVGALASAIATLKGALGVGDAVDDTTLARWGAMASARVERYAPDAPQATKDESVIRLAGYVSEMQYGTVRSEEIGPKKMEFTTNHAAAFRNCGAAGLLSPWRVRRGAPVQDE